MSLTINDLIPNNDLEFYRILTRNTSSQIRVAIPGVIQSFNAAEQTVTVQPAIQERVQNKDLSYSYVSLPLLVDVPIVLPRAGNFVLTMPVQKGDECLVVFGDMCIDSFFQNGGTQNTQPDIRRHDLSDGFALLGTWSQPRVVPNYSTDSAQLRTEDGTAYVEVKSGQVNIQASTVMINGVNFSQHVHSDPQGGMTGTPQ